MKKFTSPKNPNITISPLGEENTFVSGNKNWRIEYATLNGIEFKKGTKVVWIDPDSIKLKKYKGKIEWLILIDNGEVEVSIGHPELGRLSLEDLV